MKRKPLLFAILALLLVFSLAACGGNKDAESTTAPSANDTASAPTDNSAADSSTPASVAPTATPEPTNTPVPPTATTVPTDTPEPEEEITGDFVSIEDVVDSYHSKGEFSYEVTAKPDNGEEPFNITMTFESDWVKANNPFGSNVATTISGLNLSQDNNEEKGTPQDFQLISVDDTTYMKVNDQWITAPRDQMGKDESMAFNIDDFVASMDELKRVGKEKVNGIDAIHYQYKDSSMFEDALNGVLEAQLKENENVDQFEAVDTTTSGDIWIARKGNYPVKAEIKMEATFKAKDAANGASKEVHIKGYTVVEITDINGDITVEPPAEAPKPDEVSLPGFESGAFPIPEQTTIEGSFGGMTNLTSQLSADEINAFYDEELPKLGWTKQGDMMPSWTKGDNSFILMVTPNDDNTSTIIIMTNPQ